MSKPESVPDTLTAAISRMIETAPPPDDRSRVLARLALNLAGRLDGEIDDRAAPPVAKELRATLDELSSGGESVDQWEKLEELLSASSSN